MFHIFPQSQMLHGAGISTYKTGSFLGWWCRSIFQHHGSPLRYITLWLYHYQKCTVFSSRNFLSSKDVTLYHLKTTVYHIISDYITIYHIIKPQWLFIVFRGVETTNKHNIRFYRLSTTVYTVFVNLSFTFQKILGTGNLTYVAIENAPLIFDLPINNGAFFP